VLGAGWWFFRRASWRKPESNLSLWPGAKKIAVFAMCGLIFSDGAQKNATVEGPIKQRFSECALKATQHWMTIIRTLSLSTSGSVLGQWD